ncbi:MAG: diiron oxygenase [Pirellulales bacterium]
MIAPTTSNLLLKRHIDRLQRIRESWDERAGVRQPQPSLDWDPEYPDFLVGLLPFHDHPDFAAAPYEMRMKALTCGWLAYNEKTVCIESQIIGPACSHLINGEIGDFRGDEHRETIAEAMVDEAYHILLVSRSSSISRTRRGLTNVVIPQCSLVTDMKRRQEDFPEEWKKRLVTVATSIVSETLISEYLSRLASAPGVQPLHCVTTEIHRRDEAAHNGVFKSLGAMLYHTLSLREREFFLDVLVEPTRWFGNPDLDVWHAMLRQIDFPKADRIIADCRAEAARHTNQLDLSTLESLFADLGVVRELQV